MDQLATPNAMDTPIRVPWWRRKHWLQLAIAAALAVLGVTTAITLFGTAERSVRMPIANVTIATVESGAFHDFVPLRATVVPLDTVYLDARSRSCRPTRPSSSRIASPTRNPWRRSITTSSA